MDDRHDLLVMELERRGWMAGTLRHRHDHKGPVGFAFGTPGAAEISVSPVRDIPARIDVERRVTYHAVPGVGYQIEAVNASGRHMATATTAKAAVDAMEAWRDGLASDAATAFDEACGRLGRSAE